MSAMNFHRDVRAQGDELLHRCVGDLGLGHRTDVVHELVPAMIQEPEGFLDFLGIEHGTVGDADLGFLLVVSFTQCDLQGVVADDTFGNELGRGSQGAVAAGGQEQATFDAIAADDVVFEVGVGHCPISGSAEQDTGRFQVHVADGDQFFEEVQHVAGLDDFVGVGHDAQAIAGVVAVQDALTFEFLRDGTEVDAGGLLAFAVHHGDVELDRNTDDVVVHASFFSPHFDRSTLSQALTQTVPCVSADEGESCFTVYSVDTVCHVFSPGCLRKYSVDRDILPRVQGKVN